MLTRVLLHVIKSSIPVDELMNFIFFLDFTGTFIENVDCDISTSNDIFHFKFLVATAIIRFDEIACIIRLTASYKLKLN